MRRLRFLVVGFVVASFAAATNPASPAYATADASKPPPNSPTATPVAIPVVPCPVTSGTNQTPVVGVPQRLAATLPGSISSRLNFYSNGEMSVLAPKGWACTSLFATDGGHNLVAYPPGQANPSNGSAPPDAQGVVGILDYTGHGPGVEEICGLFPNAPVVQHYETEVGNCHQSPSETISRVTPDVATFRDPPNVKGSGDFVGDANPISGVAIFPQNDPGNVGDITKETCGLASRDSAVCAWIIGDFMVRSFPIELAQSG
jgi:hypothetical protein